MTLGVTTDLIMSMSMLSIAIWSLSLTLFADALRASLLTFLELFVFAMLRRIHRKQLPSFQYGAGKIEHFLNLLIGAGLLVASAWVFGLGALKLIYPPAPSPLGLAAATVVSAVNVGQNAWTFVAMWRAGRHGTSIIINGQVRTRLLKLLASIIATIAILVSAILGGRGAGLLADLSGSAVVVVMMLWTAYQLIASALPDLLDRMLDDHQQAAINAVLIRHFAAFDLLHHLRTRRSGDTVFVEIGLGYAANRSMGDVDSVNQAVMRDVEVMILGAKVSVIATACAEPAADTRPAHVAPLNEALWIAGVRLDESNAKDVAPVVRLIAALNRDDGLNSTPAQGVGRGPAPALTDLKPLFDAGPIPGIVH